MKDELGGKIITEFAVVRLKRILTWWMMVLMIKRVKEQKICNKKNT